MNSIVSPCGMVCSECTAFIATQNNDIAMKQQMAIDYEKSMGTPITIEELECYGCHSEHHIAFCEQCQIRSCSNQKGYQTCAECADFPCPKGDFIWKEHSKTKEKLLSLR